MIFFGVVVVVVSNKANSPCLLAESCEQLTDNNTLKRGKMCADKSRVVLVLGLNGCSGASFLNQSESLVK